MSASAASSAASRARVRKNIIGGLAVEGGERHKETLATSRGLFSLTLRISL